jgi:hypothetical protein
MYQNYQEFMDYWENRLKGSGSHTIFASINIYNILRYLRVYWDANGRGKPHLDLKGFEKILVKKLIGLIENECPDLRIIKSLNPSYAESLTNDVIILLPPVRLRINENSIEKIDKLLELYHGEDFKKLVFNHIFDSHLSEKDSKYLTDCILRILVEEHSIDFLDKLPLQSFVRCVMDKYGQQITQELEKDFENHIQIFDNLHRFMREQLLPEIFDDVEKADNFKANITGGEHPTPLHLKLEFVSTTCESN